MNEGNNGMTNTSLTNISDDESISASLNIEMNEVNASPIIKFMNKDNASPAIKSGNEMISTKALNFIRTKRASHTNILCLKGYLTKTLNFISTDIFIINQQRNWMPTVCT